LPAMVKQVGRLVGKPELHGSEVWRVPDIPEGA